MVLRLPCFEIELHMKNVVPLMSTTKAHNTTQSKKTTNTATARQQDVLLCTNHFANDFYTEADKHIVINMLLFAQQGDGGA